jgi:hypothetical protein
MVLNHYFIITKPTMFSNLTRKFITTAVRNYHYEKPSNVKSTWEIMRESKRREQSLNQHHAQGTHVQPNVKEPAKLETSTTIPPPNEDTFELFCANYHKKYVKLMWYGGLAGGSWSVGSSLAFIEDLPPKRELMKSIGVGMIAGYLPILIAGYGGFRFINDTLDF